MGGDGHKSIRSCDPGRMAHACVAGIATVRCAPLQSSATVAYCAMPTCAGTRDGSDGAAVYQGGDDDYREYG